MTSLHAADPAAPSGILKSITDEEPVLAGFVGTLVVGEVGNILLANHVVSSVQWSGNEASLTGTVSTVVLLGIGWLVRRAVASPKTQRAVQAALDAAKAAAAQASIPVVVNVNGAITAADTSTGVPAPVLDGLPAIQPTA